jgi:ABC-2 type transport system ATP-binding protein
MSAVNNMKIVADIRGVNYSEIDAVLKQVGLYERRNSKFKTFSLGMKQRLAIGATLLGNPEVLILDEPTNGLDPEGIAEVRTLIKDLASQDRTIILASHLLDEVQKVCTQIIILKKGNKVFQGSVSGLAKDRNCIEVKAKDMDALENLLKSNSDFSDRKRDGDLFQVMVEQSVSTAALNEYLHQHNLIVSHLAYRQESLEENIFEILKNHND